MFLIGGRERETGGERGRDVLDGVKEEEKYTAHSKQVHVLIPDYNI